MIIIILKSITVLFIGSKYLFFSLGMSSTSSSGFRFNYPMKKSLDRIRTLTSFDQPSFIIESPRESDGSHSLAANISDRKPSLEDIKETDTSILIESNPNHMSVPEVKTNRRYSYGGETNDNRLKPFRRTRYSADDICRISRIFGKSCCAILKNSFNL